MSADTTLSFEAWVRALPSSPMVVPSETINKIKYAMWKVITPVHPYLRDGVERLGITRERFVRHAHHGRQDFLLGTLAPGQSLKEFISFCVSKGYGNHFVAWHDNGQVVSLRYVEDFEYQYHLRVFEDGEVRGHYEYTPECYPISHLKGIGQEDRRQVFLRQFEGHIVPAHESE